jgi:hypothetical protein
VFDRFEMHCSTINEYEAMVLDISFGDVRFQLSKRFVYAMPCEVDQYLRQTSSGYTSMHEQIDACQERDY